MGWFVGSIHIQGGTASEILPELGKLHKLHGTKFVVEDGPGGWCGVFPEHQGQDGNLAREIMKASGKPSVNFTVHDSDILFVEIYDGISSFQTYNNKPDYFGEKLSELEIAVLKAFPKNLSLFASPEKIEKLKSLFGSLDENPMVDDAFRDLSKILDIPQARYSYEDIEKGDYVSAARRSKLLFVPDKSAEKALQAVVKEKIKQLKKSGLLHFEKKIIGWGGGAYFSWQDDPVTGHAAVFAFDKHLMEKKIWASGDYNPVRENPRLTARVPAGFGYALTWDKDRRIHCLENESRKILYEFPKGMNVHSARLTQDQRFLLFDSREEPGWLDLATLERGLLDSQGVLKDRGNLFWDQGPEPLIGMNKGGLFALYDWVTHELLSHGRPAFPALSEDLFSKCLWRRESHERWEQSEHFMLKFRHASFRTLWRIHFDPRKKYLFLSDGYFFGKFNLESLLKTKGGEIVPEWALFYTACSAEHIQKFSNSGGCGFPAIFDPSSGLWLFGDMMGVLWAMEAETPKLYRILEMPRQLTAHKMAILGKGRYLMVQGMIPKGPLNYDMGLQVYDLEKLISLKKKNSNGFLVIRTG